MNGFDLSSISSVYVGSTLYSSIYYGSTLIWPILNQLTTGLPSGYKLLEYITGDTNWSFIDTGISYDTNLRVECDLLDNQWAQYGAFFGAYESESSPSFRLIYTNLQVAQGYYTGCSIASSSIQVGVGYIGYKRHIILDKDGIDIDGTYTANNKTISSASLNKNILIGRISIPTTQPASAATRTITIYTFRMWNNGTLVFDGIPCIRTSDNTVGLYDTVSRRLLLPYYSDGSFTAGPELIDVSYIKPSNNAYISYDLQKTRTDINNASYIEYTTECIIDGTNGAEGSNEVYFFVGVSGGKFYSGLGGSYHTSSINNDGKKHIIKLIKENNTVNLYLDGTIIDTYAYNSSSGNLNATISSFGLFNITGHSSHLTNLRKNYAKLVIDNNTIFEMVSVSANNVGYMYDKVTGTLYGTLNSDHFIIGSYIGQYDAEIEYLQSSGTQYINLNIVPDTDTGLYTKIKRDTTDSDNYAIGLRDTSGNTRWCIGCSNSNGWYYGYGGYSAIGQNTNKNLVSEVKLNYLNDGLTSVVATEGSGSKTLPTLSFTPENKVRLFGASGITGGYMRFYGNIYEVKISQGSQVVYDLIPVRVGTLGYMYDKLSGTLFANEGTGDFVLGPDKQ